MSAILVDFWNRPYDESFRLDHNRRVAAGAPYAHLYTLPEMLKRYRLLSKPRRVFDLATGWTMAPGEFHGRYTASNVRIGKKRFPVSHLWLKEAASSQGVFFHTVNEQGEIERQGQVIAVNDRGRSYLVQHYEWLLGDACGEPVEVDSHSTEGWFWYGSAAEMRAAYEKRGTQCHTK